MENKTKNSLFNAILSAICVFVGVGFITGAEIWFYFARFGLGACVGLIVFGVLTFCLVMYSFLNGIGLSERQRKIQTKAEILCEMLVGSAMISGLMETTQVLFSNCWLAVFLIAFCILIFLFCTEKKSFLAYNYFVAIFVVFVIISLFVFNNNFNGVNLQNLTQNFSIKNMFLSPVFACIYIFMNIAEIKPVLEKYGDKYNKKKRILFSLIFTSVLIFLVIMFSVVLLNNNNILKESMPFLTFFKNKRKVFCYVFMVGLILTLLSTALACFIGVKNKIKLSKNDEKFTRLLVIITSLILGQIPFVFFIKIVYPFIAILNFLLFLTKIYFSKKSKKI